ncbi:unnamed protein product [Gongylonema pulchrum]|uniref:Uncharacterized protein n=1 Tax=Gongylonema pulchrum TaxID=637853 RepID=A0A3P7N9I6_9BILA|nr:unnamed protein product [Gongylonema pulchrum]
MITDEDEELTKEYVTGEELEQQNSLVSNEDEEELAKEYVIVTGEELEEEYSLITDEAWIENGQLDKNDA